VGPRRRGSEQRGASVSKGLVLVMDRDPSGQGVAEKRLVHRLSARRPNRPRCSSHVAACAIEPLLLRLLTS
ncbi:MAG: hypothetical protein ACLP7Q_14865, partial [Isosphaeraceae bacterium]